MASLSAVMVLTAFLQVDLVPSRKVVCPCYLRSAMSASHFPTFSDVIIDRRCIRLGGSGEETLVACHRANSVSGHYWMTPLPSRSPRR
ncbi:hypothetical protein EDD16DRAFT_1554025 [Pisolithus croceorrhizus]|nr:hypothetical protein EV401DRAFT_677226 [Pisolithus croceorrhizus]KAI6126342.1 hypothetical protein EDD16DRAFT_1554025 [Pisolithus croceorrhizus]KAI6167658.1 hypothetical protein EDD17DRAFT_1533782 [Pisolithus thermaeus]